MRRILIIFTLMVSSFFICNSNVKAEEINITVNNFDLLNEDFYNFKDLVIQKAGAKRYFIYYAENQYRAIILSTATSTKFSFIIRDNLLKFSQTDIYGYYYYSNNSITFKNIGPTNPSFTVYSFIEPSNYFYLDSSLTEYELSNTLSNLVIKNKNITYNFLPNLNQMYSDFIAQDDPFEEDKSIINTFYSVIFTKISDLATSFANNYTFLLILGIFILIFVFELIRRWLL